MGVLIENRLLFIREQMGVLIDGKCEPKQYRTSSKNAETGHHFDSFKNLYVFSKMGIRTNVSFEVKSLQFGVLAELACSAYTHGVLLNPQG